MRVVVTLIVDASIVLAWYLVDEVTPQTDAVFEQVARHGGHVPSLWKLEVANSFRTAVRRQRMTKQYRDQSLADLTKLQLTIDTHTDQHAWSATLALSDQYDLTTYDAAYLELAVRKSLPLATLDNKLAQAARSAGVPTLP